MDPVCAVEGLQRGTSNRQDMQETGYTHLLSAVFQELGGAEKLCNLLPVGDGVLCPRSARILTRAMKRAYPYGKHAKNGLVDRLLLVLRELPGRKAVLRPL